MVSHSALSAYSEWLIALRLWPICSFCLCAIKIMTSITTMVSWSAGRSCMCAATNWSNYKNKCRKEKTGNCLKMLHYMRDKNMISWVQLWYLKLRQCSVNCLLVSNWWLLTATLVNPSNILRKLFFTLNCLLYLDIKSDVFLFISIQYIAVVMAVIATAWVGAEVWATPLLSILSYSTGRAIAQVI